SAVPSGLAGLITQVLNPDDPSDSDDVDALSISTSTDGNVAPSLAAEARDRKARAAVAELIAEAAANQPILSSADATDPVHSSSHPPSSTPPASESPITSVPEPSPAMSVATSTTTTVPSTTPTDPVPHSPSPTPTATSQPLASSSSSYASGPTSTQPAHPRPHVSPWRSFLRTVFSCCYPVISHSQVDNEQGTGGVNGRTGQPMANAKAAGAKTTDGALTGTVGIAAASAVTTAKTNTSTPPVALAADAQKDTTVDSEEAVDETSREAPAPAPTALLPPLLPQHIGKKCLVLDLDETLVHSSFKAVQQADYIIPVEIDGTCHQVYVLKRPGVDAFLERLGPQFEIVIFTASLSKYADPVLDKLDKSGVVTHRLFRESCIHLRGNYVKDLSMLGRDLKDVLILDNSPASYALHVSNAVPVSSWFNDPNDTELADLVPFLEDLRAVDDVRTVLDPTVMH
ncbi:hypothetical protein HKX48_001232, partial [Thoreauomyces humboldtii]